MLYIYIWYIIYAYCTYILYNGVYIMRMLSVHHVQQKTTWNAVTGGAGETCFFAK